MDDDEIIPGSVTDASDLGKINLNNNELPNNGWISHKGLKIWRNDNTDKIPLRCKIFGHKWEYAMYVRNIEEMYYPVDKSNGTDRICRRCEKIEIYNERIGKWE